MQRLLIIIGAILILAGLFFNEVYSAVGITNPLSVPYLLPSLSFALSLLAIVAYRLNIADRPFVTVPNRAGFIKRG
jgi:hypothetical protein